jgi:adenylate cyclase
MSRLSKAVTVGLLVGILGMVASFLPVASDLEENIGLDLLFKLRGKREVSSDVVIVTMDKASADSLNLPTQPEKWPRSLHARLTENLVKEGAAVIAFDIIFDEARSTEHDNLFAEAISNARNVVLSEYLRKETVPLTDEGGAHTGDLNIERLVPPIPPLARTALALAPFPLPKVPVKVSQYWTFKTSSGDTPTLPIVVFQIFAFEVYDEFIRLMETVSPSQAEKLPRDRHAIITTKSVERLIRVQRDIFKKKPLIAEKMLEELQNSKTLLVDVKKNQVLKSLIRMYQGADSRYLNFYGPPGTITTIPYYLALLPQDKSVVTQKQLHFNGKAVFVGLSERLRPEQKDGFTSVFSQKSGLDISGVEIAATAFANLLEDIPVQPPNFSVHLAIIFLWGVVLGIFCLLFPTFIAAGTVIGMSILYLIATQYRFTYTGSWYPLVLPLFFQAPLAFFATVLWKYFETNRERQNIRKTFGYFLPDKVVDQLAKNMGDIKTSSQIVYGICLSTDAEQYSTLSETMDPKELSSFMNQYYEAIFEPVRQHGGTVSDVKGDSMLAIWATPHPDAVLRNQACLAALDITSAVHRFKQSSDTLQLPTRIGLHSGHMSLGTIGAIDHYEYRAVGDIVNTASRIEGLNKYLGTRILVSEEVLYDLDGFLTRECGKFLLVGKSQPIAVHELICRMEESNEQQRTLCGMFGEALSAYRRQSFEEVIGIFHKAIKTYTEDGPSIFYVKLCEKYRENPPGEMWNDVISLNKK